MTNTDPNLSQLFPNSLLYNTGSVSASATTTISGINWKFCPECGTKLNATWEFCAECGKQVASEVSITGPCYTPPGDLQWTQTFATSPQRKCMFDGLPPGAYLISCPCPKCSPQC